MTETSVTSNGAEVEMNDYSNKLSTWSPTCTTAMKIHTFCFVVSIYPCLIGARGTRYRKMIASPIAYGPEMNTVSLSPTVATPEKWLT